jgi:hypothetical protein
MLAFTLAMMRSSLETGELRRKGGEKGSGPVVCIETNIG